MTTAADQLELMCANVKTELLEYQYQKGIVGDNDRDAVAEKLYTAYLYLCEAVEILRRPSSVLERDDPSDE